MTNDPSSPVLINRSIEWLGALPDSWNPCRVKDILRSDVYGISNATESTGEFEVLGMGDIVEGKIICPGKRFVDELDLRLLLRKDDLLFNRTNSIALVGKVGLVEQDILNVTFASYLVRLRLDRNQVPRFWTYFLNSVQFGAWMRSHAIQTANQANLSSYKLRQFEVFEIREDEQKAIASYLDRETERIDGKVALLEEKARLYKELKQSVINETVTRGLDPSAPFRDSGVDWIGEIPEHWEVGSVTELTDPISVKNQPDKELLSVYRDHGVIIKSSRDDNHNRAGKDLTNYKLVRPGWLVINKMKTWQGSLGVSEYEGIVSPAYIICKTNLRKIFPKYFHFLLRSRRYIDQYNRISYGVRNDQWDMRYNDFKYLPALLPPLDEQKKIALHIESKLTKIDQIVEAIAEQVRLLKELRKTLINDVVTGKIRVTETKGGAA